MINRAERRYNEMESKMVKVSALFAVALLLAGIVVPFASAQLGEENRVARQRYVQAKSDFVQLRNQYQEARQDFLRAKNQHGLRHKATVAAASNFLDKAMSAIVSHLEKIKAFVESDWALSDSDKSRIVNKINTEVSWIEARQAELEGASRTDLVEIGKEVQNRWQNIIRANLKEYTGEVLSARADWLIGEADKVEGILQDEIDKASAAGKDVTEAQQLLDDFKTKVDLAEAEYDKAKNSFENTGDLDDVDGLFREGYNFIKAGNRYLLDVYNDAQRINSSLRG
ncbi:hypothetical protein COU62_04860 [Candidatus Pacearchaeota archaeon CG10_big_fil_rev_8_21_14_0_10_35_219]|nr:hypothetical protein [Candidatus Pacearchaeota archaeon]OIO42877.1 MAG: hypothetical protein AUJ63_01540 [Candidatus Pacearchaeota archaeon CG1_02_35_32]PIO07130.1 MAG: hypothetical protein COU62_04860 [Candidatus Pacearchaeota archaeon CG10_big_fil_rev_8_21_14_0_10_35_219]PIY81780.1 MAG: hypothetical protein COY79_00850 [Candidatus Pacearchaeota archaeon CG_4_10_14_0_8_um_filter_35_169]PIZ80926.1 MAG: hypothetical protein COY00_00215 [Candidatus Pacearchaeota archaeon CG_4_10_14_0_2_um_filt